ncbi:MAG: hypothetical protein A2X23_04295 [Chloroflexi bacterium GWC2_73_18]|nr:MAG: hypothetical protein A2X23_04295 [Chloroflexi bacterium GWC2_73_18]
MAAGRTLLADWRPRAWGGDARAMMGGRIRRAPWTALFVLGLAIAAGGAFLLSRGGSVAQTGGYLVTSSELAQRNQLAGQGAEPYASAVSELLSDAGAALTTSPSPMQPLKISGTDGPFVDDTATTYALGLAYGVTGDRRYATKAHQFIMAWVQTTTTTEDTCSGGGCQTSLVIGRTAAGFVFAADLIRPSGVLSGADEAAFKAWLRDVILPTASTETTNNWADAGVLMRVTVTDYIGDTTGFNRAIAKWRAQMDLVASDGHIPEETRRGSSGMSYTQEALQYKVAAARIAERRGVDLWTYQGSRGGTLKKAVDYLAYYWFHPSEWPWDSSVDVPSPNGMWEIAYARWRNQAYEPIIRERRPYGGYGHSAVRWTTLTNGIPLGDTVLTTGPHERFVPGERLGTDSVPLEVSWSAIAGRTGLAGFELGQQIDTAPYKKVALPTAMARRVDRMLAPGHTYRFRARAVTGDGTWGPWGYGPSFRLRLLQETNTAVQYSGTWKSAASASASGGGLRYATAAGAEAELTFVGRDVAWVSIVGPTRGSTAVYVDGVYVGAIDLYAATASVRQIVFARSWASSARHVLTIRVLGTAGRPRVDVDAFLVCA